MIKVDVVVLNFNSGKVIDRCIENLLRFENINIIVVDNGSTDESIYILNHYAMHDKITLIKNDYNLGCPEGLNCAIPYLKNKYVSFLNEDVFPKDGWLKEPIELFEKNDTIGAIGFTLYNEDGKLETGGNFIDILTGTAGGMKLDRDKWFYTTYTGLGNLIMRTELFKKIGEFNSKYFLYWDDAEYCIRIYKAGYNIVSVPSSKAIHLIGWSTNRNLSKLRKEYYPFRNSILTLLIHGNKKEIIKFLPLNYLYKIVITISNIINRCRKRENVNALYELIKFPLYFIHSMVWFILNIRWIIKCRKDIKYQYITYTLISKLDKKNYENDRWIRRKFYEIFGCLI